MARPKACLLVLGLSLAACHSARPPATVVPAPTATPPEASVETDTTDAAAAEVVARLRGLPFDDFVAAAYEALLVRSPQRVTELGLAAQLGMRNDQLDDLSLSYGRATQAIERAELDLLRTYDRESLSPRQRPSYDVFEWVLDDLVRSQAFAEHDYFVHQCRGGHHLELLRLLTETQPLSTAQDAEDYVSRLSQVDKQVAQILASLERRETAGVVPPRVVVERTRALLADYLGTDSRDPAAVDASTLSVYTRFSRRLDGITALSPAERDRLRRQALAEVEGSFVPAYIAQLSYLDHLADVATDEAGVWKLPRGDAYYAHRVRSEATTDRTPDALFDLGQEQVSRIQTELRESLWAMGYPQDLDLSELVGRAIEDAGSLPQATQADRDRVIHAWEALIERADQRMSPAFDLRPQGPVVVVGGSENAHYMPVSPDGSRTHEFHVDLSSPEQPIYIMSTVAVHEAIPGHHFQVGLAQELNLPQFRQDLRFSTFSEGWAVYAEQLAWQMGLYDEDPHGNIGRLVTKLIRAARLVVDTGIHAERWTRDEAREYLDQTIGAAPGTFDFEVDCVIAAPAAAIGPEVGFLEILGLRERANTTLGGRFELKAFHDAVIGHGNLPLDVLRRVVDDYIAAASNG